MFGYQVQSQQVFVGSSSVRVADITHNEKASVRGFHQLRTEICKYTEMKDTVSNSEKAMPPLASVSKSYSGEEFRIVKYYHGFFCHWAYRLEKKVSWWFFGRRTGWEQVAGNGNTDSIPDEWRSFNIVEEIELSVG